MKTKFRNALILSLVAMFSVAVIVSCSDDDKTPPADTTTLKASITSANDLDSSTEEGKNDGQYPTGSKATLEAAITAAQAVVDNTASTQTQVDNANVALQMAVTTYQGAVITPIASESLVAHWSFDEGTGTTVGDETANKFNGTFKTGPTDWGAGLPSWTADRTGAANKALHFDKGGNVEVPYNTALNPTAALTISVWVNADVIKADNRFLGLQSWIGYKFQLQDLNHSFVSIGYDGGTYDKDGQTALPIKEWHHIVATYGNGKTILYVDGIATQNSTYTDTPNAAKSIASKPYNLVIGQDFPTDKYSSGNGDNFGVATSPDYQVIPLAWGGYYQGSLDELRIYKIDLTATQVASLYDREKP